MLQFENEKLAMCVDVIAPEGYGEIIGGGQREENYISCLKLEQIKHIAFLIQKTIFICFYSHCTIVFN